MADILNALCLTPNALYTDAYDLREIYCKLIGTEHDISVDIHYI